MDTYVDADTVASVLEFEGERTVGVEAVASDAFGAGMAPFSGMACPTVTAALGDVWWQLGQEDRSRRAMRRAVREIGRTLAESATDGHRARP